MTLKLFLLLAVLFLVASPMFAQGGANTATQSWVTPGLAMSIASGLCALGQGRAVAGAAEGIGRNPGATAAIRFVLIFGLVFIESLALYTLVIIFIK